MPIAHGRLSQADMRLGTARGDGCFGKNGTVSGCGWAVASQLAILDERHYPLCQAVFALGIVGFLETGAE